MVEVHGTLSVPAQKAPRSYFSCNLAGKLGELRAGVAHIPTTKATMQQLLRPSRLGPAGRRWRNRADVSYPFVGASTPIIVSSIARVSYPECAVGRQSFFPTVQSRGGRQPVVVCNRVASPDVVPFFSAYDARDSSWRDRYCRERYGLS